MELFIRILLIVIQGLIMSISIIYSKKVYHRWISPVSIYVGMNGISVFLCLANMLNYYNISNFVIIILILSELILFIGDIFGNSIFNSRNRMRFTKDIYQNKTLDEVKIIHRSMHIISIISTIGIALCGKNLFQKYSLSFLLQNPAYLGLQEFQQQYIGYMNLLGIMVFPMFCYCFIKTKKVKYHDILLVCLAFLGLLLSGNKTYIIISIVCATIVYIQLTTKIHIKYIIFSLIFCIGFFILYDNYIDIFVPFLGNSKFPSFLRSLERPYLYITGGWASFSYYGLESTGNVFPYKGYVVLSAIFKVLSFIGLTDVPIFKPLQFVDIGEGIRTNVYTMVGEIYLDVGIIGLMAFYFVIGILCSYCYKLSVKEGNLQAFFISTLLMYCLFISFFSYYFNFNILFLCLATYTVISISKLSLFNLKKHINKKYLNIRESDSVNLENLYFKNGV